MAENVCDFLSYFCKPEFKFHDVIKLTDKYNITGEVDVENKQFWDIMPHYMLRLIMTSDAKSRELPYPYQKNKRRQSQSKEDFTTNPMDVFIYIFLMSDPHLRQIIVNQVSKCQLSLPLIIQDIRYPDPKIFLHAYQSLIKTYPTSDVTVKSFHVVDEKLNIFSFIRIGKCKKSVKSKLLNEVLGFNHDCFFNRNSKGSSTNRMLYNGTIEMNWYLPTKQTERLFDYPLTFFNLRGNALEFEKQTKFIFEVSTMVGIILNYNDISTNKIEIQQICKLTKENYDKICLIFSDEIEDDDDISDSIIEFCEQKLNFKPCERNVIIESSLNLIANEVRTSIKEILTRISESDSSMKFSISDCRKMFVKKEVPEEGEFSVSGFSLYDENMKIFKEIVLSKASKVSFVKNYLPLQSEGWVKYSQVDKNQVQLRHDGYLPNKAKGWCIKILELNAARNIQVNSCSNNYIAIKHLKYLMVNSKNAEDPLHMLTLLKIELEKINLNVSEASDIGVQHFVRELGQYYEMNYDLCESSSLESLYTNTKINYKFLPSLFAKLILLGQPFEIFDGEVQHIPLYWVRAVLRELSKEIGDEKRIFVLGVLGVQSSGKSTLLNTMFGLQFPVASGRCTRGVSMQLIAVDEVYARVLNYDYLVILDSEGLKSIKHDNKEMTKHDNELATFIVGIADICIVNIYGEILTDWGDLFKTMIIALMKLTFCKTSKPKCLFVHQNVSDLNANAKLKEGYRNFILQQDGVTQFISREIKTQPIYTKFTDIIDFDVDNSIKYFPSLYSEPPPMSIISKHYVNAVFNLKKDIISEYTCTQSVSTLQDWSAKIKNVWKSILKDDFIRTYKDYLEDYYHKEFENALFQWSLNYSCEVEIFISLLRDQILNEDYDQVKYKVSGYEIQLKKKSNNTMIDKENELKNYYFVQHKEYQIFSKWKRVANLHFENSRLENEKKTNIKLLAIFETAKQNKPLLDDFYENQKVIIERAKKAKLKHMVLSLNTSIDSEFPDNFFEEEWHEWIAGINFLAQKYPYRKFISPFENEIEKLTTNLKATNEEITKIKSFFEFFASNQHMPKHFVMGTNHYTLDSLYGNELQISHEYACWIDFVLKVQNRTLYNHSNLFEKNTFKKVLDLQNNISEICNNYINNICLELEFTQDFLAWIIKMISAYVEEFNSQNKNIELTIRIENVFIFELSLFFCTKIVHHFLEIYKSNQIGALKIPFKNIFLAFYNKENFSSPMACANGLATTLLEKMNLSLADKLQFQMFKDFFKVNTSAFLSKCHLQKNILSELANTPLFEKYFDYIRNPNQVMKIWIKEKFEEFCKSESTISRIKRWYEKKKKDCIIIYTNALQQSLKLNEQEGLVKIESTENCKINPSWKFEFHKLLKSEAGCTKHFKLSDLDVLIIEPHEITKPDEFVTFFTESLQKQIGIIDIYAWIKKYSTIDMPTEMIYENLFFCSVHCPLCNEPCLSTINSPEHIHYCGSFHRPLGLNGWYKNDSGEFIGHDCTNLKSNTHENIKHKELIFENCMKDTVGWDNSGTHYMIESVYWEWVMCQFPAQFASYYGYNVNGKAIRAWSSLTKHQVLTNLQRQIDDYHSTAYFWRIQKTIDHLLFSQTF